MADQVIKIPRASDRVVLDAFKSVAQGRTDITSTTGVALGSMELGAFSFDTEPSEGWAALVKLNSALLDTFTMRLGNLSISYYRGGVTGRPNDVSPVYDDIRISSNPNIGSLAPDDQLNIVAILNKKLRSFDPERALSNSGSKEAKQLEALHQSTLDRLEKIAEDVINKSTEFRLNIEQQYSEKLIRVDEELAKKKQDLEAQHKAAQDAISETEKKLDAKLAAIDDRDNTHARREIRDRMLNDVKARIETFGVSAQTSAKRRPVIMGMIGLIFLFVILLAVTFEEVRSIENRNSQLLSYNLGAAKDSAAFERVVAEQDKTPLYLLWGRLAILTIGAVGSLVFYIRWQNKWAEQHAINEFQLQQFYIDVNRANWAIESGLEWHKETSSEMPDNLLSSVTKNLFNAQAEPETVLHPADELASALLGSASKVKLKVGDSEVDFDKPGKIGKKAKL